MSYKKKKKKTFYFLFFNLFGLKKNFLIEEREGEIVGYGMGLSFLSLFLQIVWVNEEKG